MSNNEQDDNELNDYLNGDSELSKVYRATKTGAPSADLDKNILQAAKDAVESKKSKSNQRFHKSKWSLPVSIAAMVTLSVSLVVTMQQESGQTLISEPKFEMQDAAIPVRKPELFEQEKRNDEASVSSEMLKKSDDKILEMDAPASATLGATADAYRTEDKAKTKNAGVRQSSVKKSRAREKQQIDTLEEDVFADEQILQAVPAEKELSDLVIMKKDLGFNASEEVLFNIKRMWEQGEIENAKQAYNKFTTDYPDVASEKVEEILGSHIFNSLHEL